MNTLTPFYAPLVIALQVAIASANPVGICLHAYSPDAPADRIEAFEFERVERVNSDYRFFPSRDRSVIVTAYRFRGIIPYKNDVGPSHPEFEQLLKLYEDTARATPSARRFLNPRILVMREQAAGAAAQQEAISKLPSITLKDGTALIACRMTRIDEGFITIMHRDGISRIRADDLTVIEKKGLNTTTDEWSLEEPSVGTRDSSGEFTRMVLKNGMVLRRAIFREVQGDNLVFVANGQSVSVSADHFPDKLSLLGDEVERSLARLTNVISSKPSVAASEDSDFPKPLEQSDAHANFDMGMRYAKGEGLQHDDAEAVKWFQMAAKQGHADAQIELGDRYAKGRGVQQDDEEAAKWFRKAAVKGNADAQAILGVLYARGHGVQQEDAEAVKWFRKAAEQGNALGQSWLGHSYSAGRGVPNQDDAEAAIWFHKAADQGNADAQFELGMKYGEGHGVRKDEVEAAKWFRKAAEQGNANAQAMLGAMYAGGSGVPQQDEVEAAKWYRKAAEQGHPLGQLGLGLRYFEGSGVQKDEVEATKWLRKAAEQGNSDAYAMLEGMSAEKKRPHDIHRNSDAQDYRALLEWEVRASRLKSKLKAAGEYNEKTGTAAGLAAICDTDWSGCSSNLLNASASMKRVVQLYVDEKVSMKQLAEEIEAFHAITEEFTKRFVADMTYVKRTPEMIDEIREKISKEPDYK